MNRADRAHSPHEWPAGPNAGNLAMANTPHSGPWPHAGYETAVIQPAMSPVARMNGPPGRMRGTWQWPTPRIPALGLMRATPLDHSL